MAEEENRVFTEVCDVAQKGHLAAEYRGETVEMESQGHIFSKSSEMGYLRRSGSGFVSTHRLVERLVKWNSTIPTGLGLVAVCVFALASRKPLCIDESWYLWVCFRGSNISGC